METMYKVKPILNVQNVFLVNTLNAYVKRETERYIIAYEPKRYTFHFLIYKIDKSLISNVEFDKENKIRINRITDINVTKVQKDFSEKWEFNVKNITMRIIPTKYNNLQSNLQSLYGTVYQFYYRKTSAGGLDKIEFTIPECPIIVNSNTISNVCYKLITKQISANGTHGVETYLIVAPRKGEYVIGNHVNISNINNNGHRNMHIYPVVITL